MEKNKTGRYLKYAIGEIILVVIGILIALSINNWNDKNKEIQKQSEQLSNLSIEVKSMKSFLNGHIEHLDKAELSNKRFLEMMGPDALLNISTDTLSNLLLKAISVGIVTSEKLSFETNVNFEIANEKKHSSLIELLSNWKHFSGGIASDFILIEDNREKDLQNALIQEGIPGFSYLCINWDSPQDSKFEIDYQTLLQSHKVFAVLHNRYIRMQTIKNDLKRGIKQLDKMIYELDKQEL